MLLSVTILVLLAQLKTATAACSPIAGPTQFGTLTNTNCQNVAGSAALFTDGSINFGAGGIDSGGGGAISAGTGAVSYGGEFIGSGSAQLTGNAFTVACTCTAADVCPDTSASSSSCAVGTYAVARVGGGFDCIKFGATAALHLPNADGGQTVLDSSFTTVTINGVTTTFVFGAVLTSAAGAKIRALLLMKPNQAVVFSSCGPFIIQDGVPSRNRKRVLTTQALSAGLGSLVTSGSAGGDPHLDGANNIRFDVYGAPGANYSLVVAPAFEINMLLADYGPEMRFMTAMAVLYRGKSFIITPWTIKLQRAELIAHFEALGAQVVIDDNNWTITINICEGHTIVFATRNLDSINFLNFDLLVPGCHNAYGGLLGQTYQCKYATEKFEWSREREEEFRVPTLDTPSGSYSAEASCATEDEYHGEAIHGGSNGGGNSTLEMTAAQQVRRRRL